MVSGVTGEWQGMEEVWWGGGGETGEKELIESTGGKGKESTRWEEGREDVHAIVAMVMDNM